MSDHLTQLANHVCAKLRILGYTSPGLLLMRELLSVAYLASLKTEESRFVRGSLTYCNPSDPEIDPPFTRRANYPAFTPLGRRSRLTADSLVKLFRAVDRWSGSVAVYGTTTQNMFVWGVADQLVGQNVRLNREAETGFLAPGIVNVIIDGVGDVSAYHESVFLGRLKQNQLIKREVDALRSRMVANRVVPTLTPVARRIAAVLGEPKTVPDVLSALFEAWINTVARICIGLRRLGTGGSLLITSTPLANMLDVSHGFRYVHMSDSMILGVLDEKYRAKVRKSIEATESAGAIPVDLGYELSFAESDAEDRADELTGAVKIVTSLAAVDGLVLMNLGLSVSGFGVKIRAGSLVRTVYHARSDRHAHVAGFA